MLQAPTYMRTDNLAVNLHSPIKPLFTWVQENVPLSRSNTVQNTLLCLSRNSRSDANRLHLVEGGNTNVVDKLAVVLQDFRQSGLGVYPFEDSSLSQLHI
jgi:hypothetical protein